jgi:hypothetical protein
MSGAYDAEQQLHEQLNHGILQLKHLLTLLVEHPTEQQRLVLVEYQRATATSAGEVTCCSDITETTMSPTYC